MSNTSPVSSPHGNALEDEIVVGANANGHDKSSPLRVTSDREDEVMGDADDDQPIVSHYPKRKRASVYNDLSEDKIENSMIGEDPETKVVKVTKRIGLPSVKGVILGYWRDSPVPDELSKHAVVGFIDVRDRLRTRIQQATRMGGPISTTEWPLPPGPGGSWVTFERIVFDEHLVALDHYQVKEYVKLRSETQALDDTEEARQAAEKLAVKEAKRRVLANPPPDTAVQPAIAYGVDIPDYAMTPARPDPKRRRTGSGVGTISGGGPVASGVETTPFLDPLLGTRPTRIVIGIWKGSSEVDPKDRHAVYGILGQNDMFRVKVVRETRDGRFVDGNFPSGAGALWIHYDEVELEPHLSHLARAEVKEYCRIRQWQIDRKEKPEERIANETKAVFEAQQRVAQGAKNGMFLPPAAYQQAPPIAREEDYALDSADRKSETFGGHELRQSRRADVRSESRPPRHSLPDVEIRQASRIQPADALERTNSIARREIARAEAAQQRADRSNASREAAAAAAATSAMHAATGNYNTNGNRLRFHETDEMQRLNKVWARQEASRLRSGAEDAKIYGGIKYERKQNGPFEGKLVSQGTIISIDGEDYVEYRVLTKPSFF
jgi:hypothetical protein